MIYQPDHMEKRETTPTASKETAVVTKYPGLARHSDPHRTATALTIIGIENTEAARSAGLELIESLTVDELQQLAAAFATQAASHCVRSFGGSQRRALDALQRVAVKLAALPDAK